MRIVFWGDSHIPYRAEKLPSEFLSMLKKQKPDLLVITGDLVIAEVLKGVEGYAKRVIAVRGNMDEGELMELPIINDFEVGSIRFTVFHGHRIYPRGDPQQLHEIAKRRNAHIIITGHTHYPQILEYNGTIILNPGSVCGVYGGSGGYGTPTWGIIEIMGNNKFVVKILESKGKVELYDQRVFKI